MSDTEESRATFEYQLWLKPRSRDSSGSAEVSKDEIKQFVNAALGLMTGGCEYCQHSQRMFCEKLKRPVKAGGTRCEFFERRPSALPKDYY